MNEARVTSFAVEVIRTLQIGSGVGSSMGQATVQGISPPENARKPVVCIMAG